MGSIRQLLRLPLKASFKWSNAHLEHMIFRTVKILSKLRQNASPLESFHAFYWHSLYRHFWQRFPLPIQGCCTSRKETILQRWRKSPGASAQHRDKIHHAQIRWTNSAHTIALILLQTAGLNACRFVFYQIKSIFTAPSMITLSPLHLSFRFL